MSTLRGNLQSLSLTDVVQLLHVNRKTGKLPLSQAGRIQELLDQGGLDFQDLRPGGSVFRVRTRSLFRTR